MKIRSDGNVTGFVTAGDFTMVTTGKPRVATAAGMEVVRES